MIVFNNVTKTYSTGQAALSDISFEIQEGEFVFFVGESGAGKTTIMRILTKDLLLSDGSVVVLGEDISKMKRGHIPKLRRNVSVIFQDYKLLPDRTVAENVSLALEIIGMKKEEIESRVTDLLQLVGLSEKIDFFPRQLSGGEAQRVSIARALATGPKIIFADEPTGNLDHETSMSIARLFEKINSLGTTILMATHNMDIVKSLKKREIHLSKGKLIKDTHKKHEKVKEESPSTDEKLEHEEKKDKDEDEKKTKTEHKEKHTHDEKLTKEKEKHQEKKTEDKDKEKKEKESTEEENKSDE